MRIGIAGPSCSGKSTVARLLAATIGAPVMSLDDYYVKKHTRRYVMEGGERVRSYEHPGAYDGSLLLDWARSQADVVAEGFLLFRYPSSERVFDLRIFLDLPWDEIVRRRGERKGQNASRVQESFNRIGRSEWELYGARQRDFPGVVTLDAMRPVGDILTDCEALLGLGPGREPGRQQVP